MPTRKKTQPRAPARTRILLVDDHSLLRRGLRALIETEPDLAVCAEADTRQGGLDAIVSSKPDLVIVDIWLKDSDGLQMIKDVRQRFPRLPVLTLSMHEEEIYAERALRAGARGYVTKREINDTVLTAIRRVLVGEIHTSAAMSRKFTQQFVGGGAPEKRAGLELLSDSELEVFALIGRGNTTRKIAQFLRLGVKTIQSHKERLKAKLQISSGIDLTQRATLWVETGRMS